MSIPTPLAQGDSTVPGGEGSKWEEALKLAPRETKKGSKTVFALP